MWRPSTSRARRRPGGAGDRADGVLGLGGLGAHEVAAHAEDADDRESADSRTTPPRTRHENDDPRGAFFGGWGGRGISRAAGRVASVPISSFRGDGDALCHPGNARGARRVCTMLDPSFRLLSIRPRCRKPRRPPWEAKSADTLAAEAAEALAAPFVGRAEDGSLADVLVPRAGTEPMRCSAPRRRSKTSSTPVSCGSPRSTRSTGGKIGALVRARGRRAAADAARGRQGALASDVTSGSRSTSSTAWPPRTAEGSRTAAFGPHLVLVGATGGAHRRHRRRQGPGQGARAEDAERPAGVTSPERVKTASSGGAPAADAKCDVFSAAVLAGSSSRSSGCSRDGSNRRSSRRC